MNYKHEKNLILKNYKKILTCILPVIPHFSNEALSSLNINDDITWPNYDEKILSETTIPYVIQINGKKRALIQVHRDTSEQNLIKLITNETNLKKYLENKEIKRKIFVPGKLINIIV